MADLVLGPVTVGNTVTLTCTFRDSASTATAPDDDVTLQIYGPDGSQIGTDITIPLADAVATGAFEYDYVVPNVERFFDYAYSATIDGTTERGRARVKVSTLTQE